MNAPFGEGDFVSPANMRSASVQKIARTFTPVNRSCDLPERPSESLIAANQRLLVLREQIACTKTVADSRTESSDISLPAHLGWGSGRLPHSSKKSQKGAVSAESSPFTLPAPCEPLAQAPPKQRPTTVTLYPELSTAFLKYELSATGRIWLLLRHIDVDGRGWVAVDEARQQLTSKKATLRVCGWRQFRNLLHAGNGTFWKRDKNRIWLRSVAKVAIQLQVERLGKLVSIQTKSLTANIQTVRATFYAIGHSARNSSPISRSKLADITGVNERTQRRYDLVANVQKTTNYCLGNPEGERQEQAWHQRHAAFDFVDKLGKHGQVGKKYRAFQLPNSYTVYYQATAIGRTRKINKRLRQDLVRNRAQGNSRIQVEKKRVFGLQQAQPSRRKLFFNNGQLANKQQGDNYLKMHVSSNQTFWIHFA